MTVPDYAKLLFALFLQLIGLILMTVTDPYPRRTQKRILLLISALALSLLWQNVLQYRLETESGDSFVRTAVSVYGYAVYPMIPLLFLKVLNPERRRTAFWICLGVNLLVYLTAFFSELAFRVGTDNRIYSGPLGHTSLVLCVVLLLWLSVESFQKCRGDRLQEALIPVFNAGIVFAATAADCFTRSSPVSWLTVSAVSACILYYLWLHLQFVREHEKARETEQRIQIMISQIQPHFLYNTLATIQALCRIDPNQASDTTEKFANYLRQNIESLRQTDLIPFEKELEHTRIYAEIEMLRFPSVRIEYAVEDADFFLPPLTVQPLVENAIRHGVRGRQMGLVQVSTYTEPDAHVIRIQDNGKGFQPERLKTLDESHIGIRNVRERLKMLCDGTLEVSSAPGEGTTVTIRIPRGEEIL